MKRQPMLAALLTVVAASALASGCTSLGARATVRANSVVNDDAGWSLRAARGRPLLPARWLLRSHDVEGTPIDPFDDLVFALDTDGDGDGDQNVDARRFEVRFEDPTVRATIWFRLVPLDVARSRRTLTELGTIYTEQLRGRSVLDATIAALTRGAAVGPPTTTFYLPGSTVGRGANAVATGGRLVGGGPGWVEVDPTARVIADVSLLAARDATVGGAAARQLLVDVAAYPDPGTARLREAAIAAGDFMVPDRVRVAVTLVRIPGRFTCTNPYGGIEMPLLLLVGYAAPPESFAAGLDDYRALLQQVHVAADE